jgi:ABC-type Fe3+-hydroxamate transport system substrate-binding protein
MTAPTADAFVDAVGTAHRTHDAPRIVSLVPSVTELLCALGLAHALVGRTGFCIHPRDVVRRIPKVGGTKDVRIERVAALAPTHLVVNVEENRREDVDAMRAFVPHVVVTYPRAPEDNVALYRLLGGVFDRQAEAGQLVGEFTTALEAARAAHAARPRERVLYLVWRKPWMAAGADTYIARTLGVVGWDVVPSVTSADVATRYPEVADDAFPACDRVLLSSEPYRFTDAHRAEVAERAGLPAARVTLVDGEMTSWYGNRAITGMAWLARYRAALAGAD